MNFALLYAIYPRMRGRLLALLGSTLVVATACSSTEGEATSTQDASAEGGADGPVADAPVEAPSGCNASADPKSEPRCVDDGFAAFVSAAGNNANDGTKDKPLKTIAAALAKGKSRIYVCEGTYPEHVKITTGIALVGGFACSGWTYSGTKAKIAPTDAGFALELAGADGATVSDLAFEAPLATAASRSSIAAFAHGAKGKLLRVELTAHEGKSGAGAATGSNYDPTLMADDAKLTGQTATGTVGGAQQNCPGLCTNSDHSTGGKGGTGGAGPTAGDPGKPDRGAGLAGAVNSSCAGVGTGGNGNPGAPGDDAVPATTAGTLNEQGWAPSDGVAAKAGGPGQGGGGGGGATSGANGAGGGGGCGGCGGAAGSIAEGGGASIALLSLNSTLTLVSATLTSAKAGDGGAGTAGQVGQVGGAGGTQATLGCQGGKGGAGGPGGASAGGAGGISAGVVSKGGTPTLDAETKTTTGDKGSKGEGGKPGTNDGPNGQKADAVELP